VVALMILFHNLIGTWKNKVDKYIALTEFQKQKMVEGGLPVAKITVKPNCIGNKVKHDLMTQTLNSNSEQYALCVGRLSPEKGIFTLLDAWKLIVKKTNDKNFMDKKKLMIAGSGPQKKELEAYAITLGIDSYVTFLGQQSRSEIADLMLSARFLIFPSLWYETFGLTVLEAGILGTPSIISSGITTSSIIEDGISGICFERGNAEDLAVKIRWAMSNPVECANIGRAASKKFSERFSSEVNEHLLILIYQEVIKKNDCNPIIK
jgi:glycosyltransferase involved in cell wall biosynthesis